tara:strand:- start:1563 stop:3689 length:2127 start_codon:yes stop_codon:yes gene_type:complete
MTLALGFILTNYILYSLGIIALWVSEALNPAVVILSLLLLSLLFTAERKEKIPIIKNKNFYGFYFGPLTVIFLYFVLNLPLLDTFCYILLALLFTRIIYKKEINDYLFCNIISLACLLIGAMGTADFSFGLIFMAFFIVISWSMILYHLRVEKEDEIKLESKAHRYAPSDKDAFKKEKIEGSFFGLTSFLVLSSFIITLIIFFFMPRLAKGYLTLYQKSGSPISGFSNEVELGDIGRIKLDQSVVMRIETFQGEKKLIPGNDVYWRGIALDHYDGRRWSNTFLKKQKVRKSGRSNFEIDDAKKSSEILKQVIYLEPMDSNVIFSTGRPLNLDAPFQWIGMDYNNSLYRSGHPYGRVRLIVNSDFSTKGRYRLSPKEDNIPVLYRERYLQLPPLSKRFVNLTRDIVKGAKESHQKAKVTESYLKTQFGYTLIQSQAKDISPIDNFLFESKEGHCEYFASAMVLMLRASGIPARLVNGFLRGEWNEVGEYLQVRQSHAHSWVEALLDKKGWVVFDPTPAAAIPTFSNTIFFRMDSYMDALKLKWYRYIINYTWQDQRAIAINVRHQTVKIRDKFNNNFSKMLEFFKTKIKNSRPDKMAIYIISLVLILIIGKKIFSLPALRWKKSSSYKKNVSEVYLKMLTLLRKKGFEKKETVTAKEFACQIKNDVGPAWEKIKLITDSYYEIRFGNREPIKGKNELEQSLKALSHQLS